jgi:ParB-like chromosome segregation protein Spo0J
MAVEYQFHPFANEYELLEGDDLEALADDIAAIGQTDPIIVFQGKILEGRNRWNACKLRGIDPWIEMLPEKMDPAAFVVSKNDHRRHDAGTQARKRRVARIKRIVDARKNGESIRTIAGNENITVAQVQRDIEVATVPGGGTVAPIEGKVTGKDGRKRRASTKPKKPKAEKPKTVKKKIQEEKLATSDLKDAIDQDVPTGLKPVFVKALEFKVVVNQLNEIDRILKELAKHPAGARLRLQAAEIDLKNLKRTVTFDAPYCVCPMCKGDTKTRKSNCACKNTGWLNKGSYENLPQEYRK